MEADAVVASLAALAHPVRLEIFRALVVAGPAGITPGVMAGGLSIPATTLSFHLKELTHAGLAGTERAGRNLIYRADFAAIAGVLAYLTENCCQGRSCAASAACAC